MLDKMPKLKQEISQVNPVALVGIPVLLLAASLMVILVGLLMLHWKTIFTGLYIALVGVCLPPYFIWQRVKAVMA